jgi:hypothetical protein
MDLASNEVTVPAPSSITSVGAVFVSWFVQAINDADTRKHNNSFFIFVDLEIGYSLSQ